MGRVKSKRSSLKMGAVIRKKAKAKRQRDAKIAKTKQFPKRSKKMLVAPNKMPNREQIEAEVHVGSEFINKVIKPISTQTPLAQKNDYKSNLAAIQAEIRAQYRKRVEEAQVSYQAILDAVEKADAFIEVLDARDPNTCRFLQAEGEIIGSHKKPLIIVLTKIDLVPQDNVLQWIAKLNTVAPTVAVMGLQTESMTAVISEALSNHTNGGKVAVFGLPHTGKTTICAQFEGKLEEIPSITFAQASEEVCLLDGAVWCGPVHEFALATIARAVSTDNQPDLFSIYGVAPAEDPAEVLQQMADLQDKKPKAAAQQFIGDLMSGTQKFFTKSVDEEELPVPEVSEAQKAALEFSVPLDLSATAYVQFARGDSFAVDEELLGEQFEEEEEDEAEGAEEEDQ